MRLLVCVEARARDIAVEIGRSGQWQALVELCGDWKLLASLEARLGRLDVALPETERRRMAERTQPAFVQTMLCLRAGAMALSALERAGIRCAGFKGLAALGYLYPGPRNRTLQDVDALISPRDVEQALTVLEGAGFKRSPEVPLREYVAFLRNSPGTAGNEAVSLRDERGGAVDLHWRLGALDVEMLLAGSTKVEMLNRPMPMLGAGHCMLLSVHHALRNDFVPGDIGRDVSDFVHWQALLSRTGQWDAVSADAERWGLAAACVALDRIVAGLREEPELKAPLKANRADQAAGHRIAGLYFDQLDSGPMNTDLAYLASPRSVLQVISGLSGGWKAYRELMRQSETSNGEDSLPLQVRLGRLVKAAGGLSLGQWKQLRALSEAKDRMAGMQGPVL
jgi:hypothetical protein